MGATTEAEVEVELQVAGRHQVANALAAVAVARALGLDLDLIADALGRARIRSRWRMEMTVRRDGGTLVNDAYNANPESMRAALDTLVQLRPRPDALTWAVLGDMLELGPGGPAEHRALGRYAAASGVDRLVLIGEYADAVAEGAREHPDPPRIHPVTDKRNAAATVLAELAADDVVLVKASRGLALETVAEEIATADPVIRPSGDSA